MYGIYFVYTAQPKPGKEDDAVKWWHEKGRAFYESFSGVKSVRAYASQFGLGGSFLIDIWNEVESYAVMDQWDQDIAANQKRFGPALRDMLTLFDVGPSRIMGEWPESQFIQMR